MTPSPFPLPLYGSVYRTTVPVVLAAQVVALGVLIAEAHWAGVTGVSLLMAASAGLFALARLHPPVVPDVAPAVVGLAGLAHAGGLVFGLYDPPNHYDAMMHFYTGFAATLAVGLAARALRLPGFRRSGRRVILACAATALAIGLAWEGMEALFQPLPLGDTLADLILDVVGGTLAGGLLSRRRLPAPAAADTPSPKPMPGPAE